VLPRLSADQRETLLGAMLAVVGATGRPTAIDHAAITGAARHVLDLDIDDRDVEALPTRSPAQHPAAIDSIGVAHFAGGVLAVLPFVDGTVDDGRIERVLEYTAALGVDDPYVRELAELAAGHLAWVIADMSRQNLASITNHPWNEDIDVDAWLLPYRGREDQELAARYEMLGALPAGTLGRTFADFYATNGFIYPGNAGALREQFGTPHDSTHVLSGCDTTPQGELLVSTFTSTMHHDRPIAGHVLPVILSWHVGITFNDVASSTTGALDPEKLWVAWRRGADATIDTFAPDWDFWDHVERPIAALRTEGRVAPLDARFAADWHTPDHWVPIA